MRKIVLLLGLAACGPGVNGTEVVSAPTVDGGAPISCPADTYCRHFPNSDQWQCIGAGEPFTALPDGTCNQLLTAQQVPCVSYWQCEITDAAPPVAVEASAPVQVEASAPVPVVDACVPPAGCTPGVVFNDQTLWTCPLNVLPPGDAGTGTCTRGIDYTCSTDWWCGPPPVVVDAAPNAPVDAAAPIVDAGATTIVPESGPYLVGDSAVACCTTASQYWTDCNAGVNSDPCHCYNTYTNFNYYNCGNLCPAETNPASCTPPAL